MSIAVKIDRFTLNQSQKTLTIAFNQEQTFTLSFEYLRVFSPHTKKKKSDTIEAHKIQVRLIAIEAVGKHGYRLIFDDNHSEIYSVNYLYEIAVGHEARWQDYLAQLKLSGHSREATINIKQL